MYVFVIFIEDYVLCCWIYLGRNKTTLSRRITSIYGLKTKKLPLVLSYYYYLILDRYMEFTRLDNKLSLCSNYNSTNYGLY